MTGFIFIFLVCVISFTSFKLLWTLLISLNFGLSSMVPYYLAWSAPEK